MGSAGVFDIRFIVFDRTESLILMSLRVARQEYDCIIPPRLQEPRYYEAYICPGYLMKKRRFPLKDQYVSYT